MEFIGAFAFYKTSLTSAVFEDAETWSAGAHGFQYFVIVFDGAYSYASAKTYSISDSAKAAEALTSSVTITLTQKGSAGNRVFTKENRQWYAEDWVKTE